MVRETKTVGEIVHRTLGLQSRLVYPFKGCFVGWWQGPIVSEITTFLLENFQFELQNFPVWTHRWTRLCLQSLSRSSKCFWDSDRVSILYYSLVSYNHLNRLKLERGDNPETPTLKFSSRYWSRRNSIRFSIEVCMDWVRTQPLTWLTWKHQN